MNKKQATYFPASAEENSEIIGAAHTNVSYTGIHPIAVLADHLEKPLEDFEHIGAFPLFPMSSRSPNVAQPFLFPEPAPLLHLCLYLEVHPADLLPRVEDVPMPRSVVQLCRDIFEGDRFSEMDKEMAFELLEYEQAAISAFQQQYPEEWKYMAERMIIVEADEWEESQPKFRSNTLQVLFADLVGQGAGYEAVYPLAPDALFCKTAKNWDMNALETVARNRLQPAYQERKRTMKVLENIGSGLFGRKHVWQSYEATKKLLEGREAITPSSDDDYAWLHACRKFYLADRAYEKEKVDLDEQTQNTIETYRKDRFDPHTFELAMAYFENDVIITADAHASPYLDHAFEA